MSELPDFCYRPRIRLIWVLFGIPFLIFLSTAGTYYIIEPPRRWAIYHAALKLFHYGSMVVTSRVFGGRTAPGTAHFQVLLLIASVLISAVYVAENKQYPYFFIATLMFFLVALCDVAAFLLATRSSEEPDSHADAEKGGN